jgi:hypothetical protein
MSPSLTSELDLVQSSSKALPSSHGSRDNLPFATKRNHTLALFGPGRSPLLGDAAVLLRAAGLPEADFCQALRRSGAAGSTITVRVSLDADTSIGTRSIGRLNRPGRLNANSYAYSGIAFSDPFAERGLAGGSGRPRQLSVRHSETIA